MAGLLRSKCDASGETALNRESKDGRVFQKSPDDFSSSSSSSRDFRSCVLHMREGNKYSGGTEKWPGL